LQDRFNDRQDAVADVQEALTRAAYIDRFMQRRNLAARAERDWTALRSDLNQLARYYNVTWNWNTASFPPAGSGNQAANRLTGTYRLATTQSDNAQDVAERATRGLSGQERERVRQMILRRLDAPDWLAIERRGRTVTMASSHAPQTTFDADGRQRIEQTKNGRTVRVSAALTGDQLVVSSSGDRGNDYHATFDLIDQGRRLRVTRRLDAERLTQPVVVSSIYDRTSDVAQLNLYTGNPNIAPASGTYQGTFAIPHATQLVAVLNNDLSTRQAREGERFSLTVRSPRAYEGAVIEGYVSRVDRSGRVTGRSEMSLEFERIRLRDGRTYSFAGYIEGLRTPDGDIVRVDNEGAVRESDSQTTRTVTRAGIGAAVGALIGAIAGGGKGAAIGAAVGAGAGAGSVFVQGRDDLDLPRGTEFTLRASAPR
jgi:hypothetical protein